MAKIQSQYDQRTPRVEASLPQASAAKGSAGMQAPMMHTGRLLTRRLDLGLPSAHAQALRDLFDGLYEKRAKLRNGKFVERPQQAILWLLENITPISE